MAASTSTEVQHYVPKFILKKFCGGKKPQLWVYDKHQGRSFKANVNRIAAESGFYDFELGEVPVTLEQSLSALEAKVAPIFKEIDRAGNIAFLDDEAKALLAYFFSVQLVRTKRHREQYRDIHNAIEEALSRQGDDITQLEGYEPPTEQSLKESGIHALANAHDYVSHFLDKSWVLMRARKGFPFITSDHPICMQNMLDHGPRGNLGLGVAGIEIYFPISTTWCLCMLCPSYQNEIIDGYQRYKTMAMAGRLPPGLALQPFELEELVAGFLEGAGVRTQDESILNINSLHVRNSYRFIFSSKNDFEMVEDILSEHPDLKTGAKFTVA
ncbi:hypothetical protein PC39_15991 [Salinisphaera sp. PC39]|uniref:DUF4238 domain-containing protein n=1 Tax=Salinisphaera sp. PC39 TaxID=1304156 RepID=UPI0033410961